MQQLTIRRPDDFHVHLRQEDLLPKMVKYTAQHFSRATIMPNTNPPIRANNVSAYRGEILSAIPSDCDFHPIMTIKLLEDTLPHEISVAHGLGVLAGKLYMRGTTTNSDDGVGEVHCMWHTFRRMEEVGMLLLIHGEKPSAFCMDREKAFLTTVYEIAKEFPKLHIVLEHITTADAVETVLALPDNVAATITVHHLLLTLDDVVGDKIQTHHFCKPIAKRPADRDSLIEAATGKMSGAHKFFFGSDSAPHLKGAKECAEGCAGVFSAPVALPLLVEIFEQHDALNHLENFVSRNGARFYRLPFNPGTITIVKKDWVVPVEYDGVVPFRAGKTISWQVLE